MHFEHRHMHDDQTPDHADAGTSQCKTTEKRRGEAGKRSVKALYKTDNKSGAASSIFVLTGDVTPKYRQTRYANKHTRGTQVNKHPRRDPRCKCMTLIAPPYQDILRRESKNTPQQVVTYQASTG